MRRLLFIVCLLVMPFTVFGQEETFDEVVRAYKSGNYREAVKLLEALEQKDDKIHYYLGLSYYKLGMEERAKRNFLAAYYIAYDSQWGQAAVKNYRHLSKKIFHFNIVPSFSYDSNVNYTPETEEKTAGAALLNLYMSGKFNITSFSNFRYSYGRNQYLKDIDSSDSHSLNLNFSGMAAELNLITRYSSVGGRPFYWIYGADAGFKNLKLEARKKEYLDQDSSYLEGYRLSGKLSTDIFGIRLSYGYDYNRAEDLEEEFVYWKHTGSIEDSEYDFEKIEDSGIDYFLSYTHQSHSLSAGKVFSIDDDTTVRLSGEYMRRNYRGENTWYRNYWVEDTSEGKNYYWDDGWVESDSGEEIPGKKQTQTRKDNRVTGRISYNHNLERDLTLGVDLEYTLNSSNMDDIASYNYNWTKGKLGVNLNYGF